jgi:hypothetical protein
MDLGFDPIIQLWRYHGQASPLFVDEGQLPRATQREWHSPQIDCCSCSFV